MSAMENFGSMSPVPNTTPANNRGPNNRLGHGVQPAIYWNDGEILAAAATHGGKEPTLGTSAHAHEVRALFDKYAVPAPTEWAVIAWVRRHQIPDRWRATLVYLLMRDGKFVTGRLFRRGLPAANV